MKNINSKKLKVYFLMINLILSTIAFSHIVGAQTPGQTGATGGGKDVQMGTGVVDLRGTSIGTPPGLTGTPGANPHQEGTMPPDTTNTNDDEGDDGDLGDEEDTGGITNFFGTLNFQSIIMKAGFGSTIFGTIGALAGGDNGALWGSLAGAVGGAVAGLTENALGPLWSTVLGAAVAIVIFILTWKKKSQEVVEWHCLPWQAPIGGEDCALCNSFDECSLYSCKSLGQACDLANPETTEQKCFWKNPYDVNSPIITMKYAKAKEKTFKINPNNAVRPPATGVKIVADGAGGCLKAFSPLEFGFQTNEPSQCKVDYNLTTTYDDMGYYVGGDSLFVENHTENLSLPGPDAINAVAPQLKNDGVYTLYVRCKDANGNFNQDAFSVNFCVEKGPDTTPPAIEGTSIPSGRPVQFNQSKLYLEVYVNEPSECKWSHEDRTYKNMENNMTCDTNLWEMNNKMVYTCRTNLTGLYSRKENTFYFRCKDKPWAAESDRNENKQSYVYKVIGTQPLNIMSVVPSMNQVISGATDTIPVYLEIGTDNGYNNGESLCYYYIGKPARDEDYILFSDTGKTAHKQRQDLVDGTYSYYFKCVDLGGNTVYNYTIFKVKSDRSSPTVIRVYKEGEELKIVTNEDAKCSYSNKDCNFEIDSGTEMTTTDNLMHTTEWKVNLNHYVRCKDKYENQPDPNVCSIIVRPSKVDTKSEVVSFS